MPFRLIILFFVFQLVIPILIYFYLFMNTKICKKYYIRSWKWFFVDTAACDILVVLGFITRECGYSKFSKVSTVAKESSDHNKWERLQNTKNIFLRLRKKPSPPAHVLLKTFSHIFITFRENKEYKKYNISNRSIIIILFLSLCQP